MNPTDEPTVLFEGKFLRLLKRGRWEYAARKKEIRAAFIAAVTDAGCLILIEEFRIPLNRVVVSLPAGLIGDTKGSESESVEEAVKRELVEEAGYAAGRVVVWTEGPTSSGLTSETISLAFAGDLKRTGPGGGLPGENIAAFEVPLAEVDAWLAAREAEGKMIDPKVFACLYLLQREGMRAKAP